MRPGRSRDRRLLARVGDQRLQIACGRGTRQHVEDAGANRFGRCVRTSGIGDADDDRIGVLAADGARDPQRITVLAQVDEAEGDRVGHVLDRVDRVDVDRLVSELPQHGLRVRVWRAPAGQNGNRTHHRPAHCFTVWKFPAPVESASTRSSEPSGR